MTDQQLELELRAWYGTNVPASETAPPALRAAVLAVPSTAPRPVIRVGERRHFAVMAAAALVAIAIAGAMLVGGITLPTPKPSPTAHPGSPPPSDSQTAAPTPRITPPVAGMVADWRQVFAASDSVSWVVSSSAAYRTQDLGATWRDVTPPSFGPASFWPLTIVDADTAYAVGQSTTILVTHNGGLDWVASNVDGGALAGPPTLSFTTPMAGTATYSGSSDVGPNPLSVFVTSDGGATWARSGSGALPELKGGIPRLQGPNAGYLWESAGLTEGQPFNNRFFLSADGGVSWQSFTFPISAISPRDELKEIVDILREPDGHFLIAIHASSPGHDLAIYESTDDPAAWRLAYDVPDTGFTPQLLTPTTWMLVSPGAIRTTLDAGAHWTSVTPAPKPAFWHVHFATTEAGWARVGGTGDPQTLIVTTDGGATWTAVGS
jgi:hypothetical protein